MTAAGMHRLAPCVGLAAVPARRRAVRRAAGTHAAKKRGAAGARTRCLLVCRAGGGEERDGQRGARGGSGDDAEEDKGESREERDVIIRGFGSSKGGKYGLGERTDGLLDLFSNPDGFFVGVVAVAALVGLAVLAGPPPQGYEQEYRDEIAAYRANKAAELRAQEEAEAQAGEVALREAAEAVAVQPPASTL